MANATLDLVDIDDDDDGHKEVCKECGEKGDSEDGIEYCCDCGHEWISKQEYDDSVSTAEAERGLGYEF